MGMRERYWYVVAGLTVGQDDTFVTVSKHHGLQPSFEKAQAELRAILADVQNEADENDYTFDYTLDDDRLTIELDNYNYEIWRIYKVKRN
jgi:hypothetical protein